MFDWKLYQNEQLIEEYLNLKIMDDVYKVNDNLHFDKKGNKVIKKTEEHILEIDLNNNLITVKLDNYEGTLSLYKSNIIDNDNEIVISYQVSNEEPINKIVISRRNLWKIN